MSAIAVCAEVAGTVQQVLVEVGSLVAANETLVIMESMKMEIAVLAPVAGRVASVRVAAADSVDEDQVLVTLEAAG